MMCGRLPFYAEKHEQLFELILRGQLRYPSRLSPPAKDLLAGLLVKNPNRRLGGGPEDWREIQCAEFFKPIDWDKLYRKEIEPPFKPQLRSDVDTQYFDLVSILLLLKASFHVGRTGGISHQKISMGCFIWVSIMKFLQIETNVINSWNLVYQFLCYRNSLRAKLSSPLHPLEMDPLELLRSSKIFKEISHNFHSTTYVNQV